MLAKRNFYQIFSLIDILTKRAVKLAERDFEVCLFLKLLLDIQTERIIKLTEGNFYVDFGLLLGFFTERVI